MGQQFLLNGLFYNKIDACMRAFQLIHGNMQFSAYREEKASKPGKFARLHRSSFASDPNNAGLYATLPLVFHNARPETGQWERAGSCK